MDYDRSHGVHPELWSIHSAAFGETAIARDELFASLDGQVVHGRSSTWRAEVVSIVAERDVTWVQIAPADDPSTSVVVRLREELPADMVLAALRSWSDLPADRRRTWIEVEPRQGAPLS